MAPRLVNFLTQTRPFASMIKSFVGMPQPRQIPVFADKTFRQSYDGRARENSSAPRQPEAGRVILWPDTFNNHFFPSVGLAAVEVLEAAGYAVVVPQAPLCCGRPLYDFGMLDRAERLLKQILETLQDEIRAGTPVIVLEPSCLAVFRDELPNLLSDNEDAKRLSAQSFALTEFLMLRSPNLKLPYLPRKALVHGHCHHKALLTMSAEESVLKKIGVDYEILDSGCCGMAGSFGFERDHYDVSIKVGELVLLPAVRGADRDTLIVADGFSCREQIAQTTDRTTLHPAEVIAMALREGTKHPATVDRESNTSEPNQSPPLKRHATGTR